MMSDSGKTGSIQLEVHQVSSRFLQRTVRVDVYRPRNVVNTSALSLLLLNDGQDLEKISFSNILGSLHDARLIRPLMCAAIHAGHERLNEYGTAGVPDFAGRGALAGLYQRFVLEELLPFLRVHYSVDAFRQKAVAGFSLGGLAAIDLLWNHPQVFSLAGVFSGSLWWRSKALDAGYQEEHDRIMHAQIRNGNFVPGLRFYFTTGSLDETSDRNGNGIIDSIDDTLGLIEELKRKGYQQGTHIQYVNYEDGRHDVATWGRALPQFLLWGWGQGSL